MLDEHNRKEFKIQSQFKKHFGITLDEANRIARENKRLSDELYYLRCLLNGLDIHTCSPVKLSDEEIKNIQDRINKLNNQ